MNLLNLDWTTLIPIIGAVLLVVFPQARVPLVAILDMLTKLLRPSTSTAAASAGQRDVVDAIGTAMTLATCDASRKHLSDALLLITNARAKPKGEPSKSEPAPVTTN